MSLPKSLGPIEVDVTRAQLVQYAAASQDFNAIHYDTQVAQSFGLPGVIVHGMLTMGVWDALFVPLYTQGYQLTALQARFRQVLQPYQTIILSGVIESADQGVRVKLTATAHGQDKPAVTGEARFSQTASANHESPMPSSPAQ
ncbi:MAG: MaoC/PaaZ C-terminal domain-containing protein [Sulfobacillus thermotolerans]|nr:MaoC/PaaZ C-terminal domain-containing protein [Sulfobacillus thermotolerans]